MQPGAAAAAASASLTFGPFVPHVFKSLGQLIETCITIHR